MSKITRRVFLQNTTLVAGGVSLGLTHRANDVPSGANERVRIALVGAGGRGCDHLPSYLALKDVEVAAVCDVDEKSASKAVQIVEAKSGKKPRTYVDLRKLLEDKSIDAVSIATPNHWHTLGAIWSMQAGKHAYVEKPISHTVWEGRKLVEAARKYDRVITQGSQRRSFPSHREAIEFLHAGKLGKLQRVHGICYKNRGSIGKTPESPVPEGVDYDLWLGPAPHRPFSRNRFHYNWHWHWDYGDGDLGNTGVHDMDIIVWAIRKKELPSRIMSLGGRFGYEDDGETPNTQVVALDYGDLQISYEVRGLKTEPYYNSRIGCIFHGTDGYLVVALDGVAAFTPKGEKIQTFGGRAPDEPHFRNFIDAIKNRKPDHVRVSALEAHLGSAFCHLPNISYRLGTLRSLSAKDPLPGFDSGNEAFHRVCQHLKENGLNLETSEFRLGRELRFDPKTERFIGDDEANRLLTRTYRQPFAVES